MRAWEGRQIKRDRKCYSCSTAATQSQMLRTVKSTERTSKKWSKILILFKMSSTGWAYKLRLKVRPTQHIGWSIFWTKIISIPKFRTINKIYLQTSISKKSNKTFVRIAKGIFVRPFRCGTVLWLEFFKQVIKPELISLWVSFKTRMHDNY